MLIKDGYKISYDSAHITISGKMESSNYDEVERYLQKLGEEFSKQKDCNILTLDVAGLSYMNSSALMCLALFLRKLQYKCKILYNGLDKLQGIQILPLVGLRREFIIIEEKQNS